MGTHSRILAWRIHGQRSLAGCSPWGPKESDTTEHLNNHHHHLRGSSVRPAAIHSIALSLVICRGHGKQAVRAFKTPGV